MTAAAAAARLNVGSSARCMLCHHRCFESRGPTPQQIATPCRACCCVVAARWLVSSRRRGAGGLQGRL